jgi:K+ transporter
MLALCVGGPTKTLQLDWQSAITACLAFLVISIFGFYAFLPFLYMVCFKESQVGLGISPPTTKRLLRIIAVSLTYYGFVCRVFMIAGVEAFFVAVIIAVLTGNHLKPFEHGQWSPVWAGAMIVIAVILHTWAERRNLGKVAVVETPE